MLVALQVRLFVGELTPLLSTGTLQSCLSLHNLATGFPVERVIQKRKMKAAMLGLPNLTSHPLSPILNFVAYPVPCVIVGGDCTKDIERRRWWSMGTISEEEEAKEKRLMCGFESLKRLWVNHVQWEMSDRSPCFPQRQKQVMLARKTVWEI